MISSFKKKKRDGFTLVELLVVIAILAVLASVSVIGYLGFTKKAKVSNDVSLTTQMNRILQAEEAGGETFDTPHDAITALKEGGLDVTKLTPTADGYSYVYDVNGTNGQKMILVDENKNVIAPEGASIDTGSKEKYFFFAGTESEVKTLTEGGWSVYLKDGFTTTAALKVKAGLDVGSNENIGVELTSSEAKTYLFRTNGETLTVNAGSATVHHYGAAKKINVTAVASNSYHEFGKAESVDFAKGRFVAEAGSEVSFVNVTATSASDIKVEVEKGAEVAAVTAANDSIVEEVKKNVSGSVNVISNEDAKKMFVYANNSMYVTIAKAIEENKKGTIKLLKDITEDIIVPADADITINLNDKNITNSSSDTIRVLLNGKLTVEGDGVVDNVTHGMACILNNGTTTLNGGKYTRSKEASTSTTDSNKNSYYNVLNHGEMTINKDVEVYSKGAFSSLIVTGYYNYTETKKGEKTAYISGTNMAEPKLTINGGSFSGGINTIKIDDGATAIINNGNFGNTTQAVIFNANKAYINGGEFEMPTSAEGFYSVESRNFNSEYNCVYTEIRGGVFKGVVKNDSANAEQLVIYGGTFNSGVQGDYTDKR